MTNKNQVQGDFYFTDWITPHVGINVGMLLKPLSAVGKLFRNWSHLIFMHLFFSF